jgi:ureidoglycolate amidohydrolase
VGMCDVFPGAVNSIPSRVKFTVDVRDTNLARRDGVLRALELGAQLIGARRGVRVNGEMLNADSPADCAVEVTEALAAACKKHGEKFMTMISRAYHDSLFISRIAPVAMLFIPCRNGYSHRPDEYSSIEDISRGTLILAETLASLAA